MSKPPAQVAFDRISSVMFQGSAKDGCNESWREKDIRMHILKGIRHYSSALLLIDGHITDEETVADHIDRAMTRGAMARAQLKE